MKQTTLFSPLSRKLNLYAFGFLAALLTFSLHQNGQAAVLMEEGFGYATGNLPSPWTSPGASIQVTNGSLLYTGLADVAGGTNRVSILGATAASRSQARTFTSNPITNGTVYCGFLLQCTLLPTADLYLIGLTTNTGTSITGSTNPIVLYTIQSGSGYQLRIRHTGASEVSATNVLNMGETHLIVMKYTFGGTGKADLFIDPNPLGTEPTNPDATSTNANGSDPINIAVVALKCQSTLGQGNWDIDTLRIGTNWADVTPSGSTCVPAGVAFSPSDETVTAGTTATFSVGPSGSNPSLQWQSSINGGTTWSNVTGGTGATNNTYTTPILAVSDNGTRYRCVVTVSCGGGSTNASGSAILTVNAVSTATGLLVDDVFALPRTTATDLTTTPTNHTEWYAAGSTANPGLTNLAPFSMTGMVQTNARVWLTYFTSNNFAPVHLNAGETIKATLKFSIDSSSDNTNSNFRIGLYNYSLSGSTRLTADASSGNANGNNVQGYMASVNFSSVFHTNNPNPTPIEIQVRTNLGDANLMGSSSDYFNLGSGGAQEGTPGFIAGNAYTAVFSVTRSNASTVGISLAFTGPSLNLSFAQADTSGTNDVDFDTFALRPLNDATTATNFTFTEFKLEKVGSSSFIITSIRALPPNQQVITWQSQAGKNYVVVSRPALNFGTWTTNATVMASGTSTSYTNTAPSPIFFRVGQTP
jgi:hypothetical protein